MKRRFLVTILSNALAAAGWALGTDLSARSTRASAGDLYVSVGFSSGAIVAFNPSGVKSTFASGLSLPYGLAFDSSGNLYESDFNTNKIFKFSSAGTKTTFASGLSGGPAGIAFGLDGKLYEADYNIHGGPHFINQFNSAGVKTVFTGAVSFPDGIAFDKAGNLFEVDVGSRNIYKFTTGGVRTTFASAPNPVALAFDVSGNLFVSDRGVSPGLGSIIKYQQDGSSTTFATGLFFPYGLAFDNSQNLFVSEGYNGESGTNNGHIYEFAPNGTRTTFASGLLDPTFLAFAPAVPEPGSLVLLLPGISLVLRRRDAR